MKNGFLLLVLVSMLASCNENGNAQRQKELGEQMQKLQDSIEHAPLFDSGQLNVSDSPVEMSERYARMKKEYDSLGKLINRK